MGWHANVALNQTPVEPEMWCEGVDMPGELMEGKSFDLTGNICCNNGVKWCALVIYNSEDKDIQNVQEGVYKVEYTNSWSINTLAKELDFSILAPGTYRLSIQGMDYDNNYFHPYAKEFKVVKPEMWCENINMPDELTEKSSFGLSGDICCNNGVKWFALVIYNSEDKDIQNVQQGVWRVEYTNRWSINTLAKELDFSILAPGTYRLSIQGMDYDNNYFHPYAKEFEVKGEHQHSYDAVITEPTCTEQGYTTHICSCGDSYVDSYVSALGHDFVDGVCTRCGAADPDYKPPVILGDVNGDGTIDTIDAIRLAKYLVDLVELTDDQKLAADVNGDGDVTALDGIRLAKFLVGLIETLRAEPDKASAR